jgi:hypothetical protein
MKTIAFISSSTKKLSSLEETCSKVLDKCFSSNIQTLSHAGTCGVCFIKTLHDACI